MFQSDRFPMSVGVVPFGRPQFLISQFPLNRVNPGVISRGFRGVKPC